MVKITLDDSIMDMIQKLAENNIGAVNVLLRLVKEESAIDPQSLLSPIGTILFLDECGIYGPNIWILYKDICKESIRDLIMLHRAVQLGFLSRHDLVNHRIDLSALNTLVCERLESFAK